MKLSHCHYAFAVLAGLGMVLSTPVAAGQHMSVESADGVRIVYESHGVGDPALVLVHGWSCDRSYWKEQLGPLSRVHRVVTIDLGGHGESGSGRASWSIAAFGADVAAVIEKLDLARVVLVGHSMGGDVIVAAARRLSGRVVGLVWVDTYKTLGTPRSAEQVRQFVEPFKADFVPTTHGLVRSMFPASADPALVERIATDMSSAPYEVAIGALEAAFTYDREVPSALAQLRLPVVALNPQAPATDLAAMQRHGVSVVLLPDVGHFPMLEDPEGFNRQLAATIGKLQDGAE